MIVFRHCDRRWPFMWEATSQPAARWHSDGDGPVQYLADTPDGAWAEFLRHEEIEDPDDLAGVSRAMWAVEVEIDKPAKPSLAREVMCGDSTSYQQCQAEARRLRDTGAHVLIAPSAALAPRSAAGYRVERGFQSGPPCEGFVYVLFGRRPDAVGWLVVDDGRPPAEILTRVRGWIRSS